MKSYKICVIFALTFELITALDLNLEKKIADEFGPLNDPFFPYEFGTGAGNREELIVERILVDESAKEGWTLGWDHSWQKWVSITLPESQLLATASHDRVTVLRAGSPAPIPIGVLSHHHGSKDISGGIGPIELIEHWNHTTRTKQPFLLVASNDFGMQALSWFKILPDRLEELKILEIPSFGKIVNLRWVKEDDTELIIIVSHDIHGKTKIDISEYSLDDSKNPHMFQRVCLEKINVNALVSGMEAVINNDRVFIAVIVGEVIQIYTYDLLDVQQGPLLTQEIQAPGVSRIQAFSLANQVYLAFNGYQANFLLIPHEGYYLEPVLHNYRSVDQWLLLPTATYRRDIVAFARDGNEVEAVLWRGSDGFVVVPHPPCFLVDASLTIISELNEVSCLMSGNWTTAAVLTVNHSPAVLMQRPALGNTLALFHVETRLKLTDSPGSILRKMHADAVHIHNRLKCLGEEVEVDWLEQRSRESSDVLEGWPHLHLLDACLLDLDKNVDELELLVEEKKANNVKVSMHVDHGKLSGNSSGRVFNESVDVQFSGNLVYGPMRSREEYEALLVAKVTLNNLRKYTVNTTVRLGSLDVSREGETSEQVPVAELPRDDDFSLVIAQDPYSPSPELRSTPAFQSINRVDKSLHESIARSLHEH